ncbi:hypothetical protein [Nocardia sp. NPDC051981]|uniref:hypothetical protein n=1 Tax=Nocardia sp. NPDC051981 TaxID=3155417 RepID=UPI00341D78AA
MKKKTRAAANRGESVGGSLQSTVANAALLLEEAMSAADHALSIDLRPVIALDGELLIRREPLPDRIRRIIAEPILNIRVIQPVSRWSEYFRSAVRRMDPPRGPKAHTAALDALIDDFTRDIENLLGTVGFAAQVETRPEGYYANIWDDFVLISHTHLARLSLTVTD